MTFIKFIFFYDIIQKNKKSGKKKLNYIIFSNFFEIQN